MNSIFNTIAGSIPAQHIINKTHIASNKSNQPVASHYHIDGWEHHWLNQKLHSTCVIAYSDIIDGTTIAPESISIITELMYKTKMKFHAETFMQFSPLVEYISKQCTDIRKISLTQGDMLITHPFLLHSSTQNSTNNLRILTNFHLYKEINLLNPVSLVEQRICRDLSSINANLLQYTINNSNIEILPSYTPIVFRTSHFKEYKLYQEQIMYLIRLLILDDTIIHPPHIMMPYTNNSDNGSIDNINIEIYNKIKKMFSIRYI